MIKIVCEAPFSTFRHQGCWSGSVCSEEKFDLKD